MKDNLEKIANSTLTNRQTDWKQWIPGVGVHYIQKAITNNESKIYDKTLFNREELLHLYHGIAIGIVVGIPVVYGMYKILELF